MSSRGAPPGSQASQGEHTYKRPFEFDYSELHTHLMGMGSPEFWRDRIMFGYLVRRLSAIRSFYKKPTSQKIDPKGNNFEADLGELVTASYKCHHVFRHDELCDESPDFAKTVEELKLQLRSTLERHADATFTFDIVYSVEKLARGLGCEDHPTYAARDDEYFRESIITKLVCSTREAFRDKFRKYVVFNERDQRYEVLYGIANEDLVNELDEETNRARKQEARKNLGQCFQMLSLRGEKPDPAQVVLYQDKFTPEFYPRRFAVKDCIYEQALEVVTFLLVHVSLRYWLFNVSYVEYSVSAKDLGSHVYWFLELGVQILNCDERSRPDLKKYLHVGVRVPFEDFIQGLYSRPLDPPSEPSGPHPKPFKKLPPCPLWERRAMDPPMDIRFLAAFSRNQAKTVHRFASTVLGIPQHELEKRFPNPCELFAQIIEEVMTIYSDIYFPFRIVYVNQKADAIDFQFHKHAERILNRAFCCDKGDRFNEQIEKLKIRLEQLTHEDTHLTGDRSSETSKALIVGLDWVSDERQNPFCSFVAPAFLELIQEYNLGIRIHGGENVLSRPRPKQDFDSTEMAHIYVLARTVVYLTDLFDFRLSPGRGPPGEMSRQDKATALRRFSDRVLREAVLDTLKKNGENNKDEKFIVEDLEDEICEALPAGVKPESLSSGCKLKTTHFLKALRRVERSKLKEIFEHHADYIWAKLPKTTQDQLKAWHFAKKSHRNPFLNSRVRIGHGVALVDWYSYDDNPNYKMLGLPLSERSPWYHRFAELRQMVEKIRETTLLEVNLSSNYYLVSSFGGRVPGTSHADPVGRLKEHRFLFTLSTDNDGIMQISSGGLLSIPAEYSLAVNHGMLEYRKIKKIVDLGNECKFHLCPRCEKEFEKKSATEILGLPGGIKIKRSHFKKVTRWWKYRYGYEGGENLTGFELEKNYFTVWYYLGHFPLLNYPVVENIKDKLCLIITGSHAFSLVHFSKGRVYMRSPFPDFAKMKKTGGLIRRDPVYNRVLNLWRSRGFIVPDYCLVLFTDAYQLLSPDDFPRHKFIPVRFERGPMLSRKSRHFPNPPGEPRGREGAWEGLDGLLTELIRRYWNVKYPKTDAMLTYTMCLQDEYLKNALSLSSSTCPFSPWVISSSVDLLQAPVAQYFCDSFRVKLLSASSRTKRSPTVRAAAHGLEHLLSEFSKFLSGLERKKFNLKIIVSLLPALCENTSEIVSYAFLELSRLRGPSVSNNTLYKYKYPLFLLLTAIMSHHFESPREDEQRSIVKVAEDFISWFDYRGTPRKFSSQFIHAFRNIMAEKAFCAFVFDRNYNDKNNTNLYIPESPWGTLLLLGHLFDKIDWSSSFRRDWWSNISYVFRQVGHYHPSLFTLSLFFSLLWRGGRDDA
eukprot:gnl/Chilomastix_cuspidata/1025.p1 GENE.gnl/Chilomastix_cuspidata/1025~~gnl/Chilomastix_cuspidata/1025.p1  ORF type:complete len:1374 (+),score=268.90 gnl/Chilomastix_cuspidata/1025:415-4536(+)